MKWLSWLKIFITVVSFHLLVNLCFQKIVETCWVVALYIICGQSEISADNQKIWPDCPMANLIFNPYFERCIKIKAIFCEM